MRTSVGRGIPDSGKLWRKRLYRIGITIGSLLLACLIIGGALACATNNNAPLPPQSQRTHVTPQNIETSIDLGIAWLANNQNPDGSWGTLSWMIVGETGLALLKLEDRAFELGYDSPFNSAYEYSENVTNGFNFLFSKALKQNPLPLQQHDNGGIIISDNPDSNNDNMGVYFSTGNTNYETGIAMMAIAASRDPSKVVNVPLILGGSPINGWPYSTVLQDAVDYLAFGQVDSGHGRGGWRYLPCNNNSSDNSSDNSVSGYAVVGLQYAENPLYGFNCIIPPFVKNELCYWISHIQNNITGGSDFGGSGYHEPGYWVNTLKTGNLLCEMAFVGMTQGNQKVKNALYYIGKYWYNQNLDPGWGWNYTNIPAYYQATYCLMKGLQSMDEPLNGITDLSGNILVTDWYQDLADVIVRQQIKDSQDPNYGSWPVSYREVLAGGAQFPADPGISTAWALLTLEMSAPPLCGDNCTCVDDSIAVSCNFTPCDNVTNSCSNNIITACSDNLTRHCYTCPQGCECLPSDNATGMQECVSDNCSFNPCSPGKKCYKSCECAGWKPVTVSWTGSSPGIWTGHCGDNLTISSVNTGTVVTVSSSENCTGPCALYDVYFLADTTDDMSNYIGAIQSAAGNIMTTLKISYPQMAFGVGNYKDFPIPPLDTINPYCFKHQLSPTETVSAAQAEISSWVASAGGDDSDGQIYALQEIATNPSIGWRPGAKRIIVWFGNSPGHDSICPVFTGTALVYSEHHLIEHVLPLKGITVLAVDLNPDQLLGLNGDPTIDAVDYDQYCGPQRGTAGQATRITSATNGLYIASSDQTVIANNIIQFITNTFANNKVPLPYQFTPIAFPHTYPVVFSAACGDELCTSCNITVKVDKVSCGCGKCMSDAAADNCSFILCDDSNEPCFGPTQPAHCYTCPQECECLTTDNATALGYDVTQTCSPCPCNAPGTPERYCYGCSCSGGDNVIITWTDSLHLPAQHQQQLSSGQINWGIASRDTGKDITISAGGITCSPPRCPFSDNWTIERVMSPSYCIPGPNDVFWSGGGSTASFDPVCPGVFKATLNAYCNGTICEPRVIHMEIGPSTSP